MRLKALLLTAALAGASLAIATPAHADVTATKPDVSVTKTAVVRTPQLSAPSPDSAVNALWYCGITFTVYTYGGDQTVATGEVTCDQVVDAIAMTISFFRWSDGALLKVAPTKYCWNTWYCYNGAGYQSSDYLNVQLCVSSFKGDGWAYACRMVFKV